MLGKTEDKGEVLIVWTATEGNFGSKSQREAAEAKSVDDDDDFDVIDNSCHDNDDNDDSDDSDDDDDSDDSDDSDDRDDRDDSNDDSNKECEVHDSEDKLMERDKGNISSTAGRITNKPESSLLGNSEDTLLYIIMKEANVECFPTLEDATPIIEAYEVRSGNSFAIKRSLHDKFRPFWCHEHIDCFFLSKRRSDGMFCVSRMKRRHAELR